MAALSKSFGRREKHARSRRLERFVLLYNALPSRQDLRVANNWRSQLLYLPILIIAGIWLCRSH